MDRRRERLDQQEIKPGLRLNHGTYERVKGNLVRVAKKYIDLDHLNIVIVGDRATIEEPLRRTGIAPVPRETTTARFAA